MNKSAITLGSSIFAAMTLAAVAGAQVEVGDQPSYSFRSPLLQGQGAKSLLDLQGRPVLVEFWGTN